MHKRLVVNIFSSLLLVAALISKTVYEAEKTVVNNSKVAGMPWYNRIGECVVQAGTEININASQLGPSNTDEPQ
ncbi:autoinducer 2 ABC transporter substrate-binding protein, partial [Klebsiella pneumoniae]|nr:autoinducer 2 ABC transporter substrate-binding protein [Klebsiella pneumoniae]